MAAGGLLPDDIMLKIVTSKLDVLHNKVCCLSPIGFSEATVSHETLALDLGRLPPNSWSREAPRRPSFVSCT